MFAPPAVLLCASPWRVVSLAPHFLCPHPCSLSFIAVYASVDCREQLIVHSFVFDCTQLCVVQHIVFSLNCVRHLLRAGAVRLCSNCGTVWTTGESGFDFQQRWTPPPVRHRIGAVSGPHLLLDPRGRNGRAWGSPHNFSYCWTGLYVWIFTSTPPYVFLRVLNVLGTGTAVRLLSLCSLILWARALNVHRHMFCLFLGYLT